MKPQSAQLKTPKEVSAFGKRAQSAAKGFGRPKADKYSREASSRMDKFVKERKGL